jgi:ABC-type microcin C transport system permease subunit YejB
VVSLRGLTPNWDTLSWAKVTDSHLCVTTPVLAMVLCSATAVLTKTLSEEIRKQYVLTASPKA